MNTTRWATIALGIAALCGCGDSAAGPGDAGPAADAGAEAATLDAAADAREPDAAACERPATAGLSALCTNAGAGTLAATPPASTVSTVIVNLPGLGDIPLKQTTGIRYAVRGGLVLYGDLYQPAATPATPPGILVYVHGGGWKNCDYRLKTVDGYVRTLAALGQFAVYNLEYRMIQEGGVYPENLRDVKCGVGAIAASAATYGLDGSRIAIAGDSAGAHLAALVAETGARDDLRDPACTAPPALQGVVAFSGIYDLEQYATAAQFSDPAFNSGGDSPRKLAEGLTKRACSSGGVSNCDSKAPCAVCTDASPAAHTCTGTAPYLLIHAPEGYDPVVPAAQAQLMQRQLLASGRSVQLVQPTAAEMGALGAACPNPRLAHALLPCLTVPTLRAVSSFSNRNCRLSSAALTARDMQSAVCAAPVVTHANRDHKWHA